MKLNRNLAVFLMFGVFIERSNSKELNLNFQQNDYQVKFERIELVRYNKEYLKDVSIVTFKYNRTLAVANITYTFKRDVGYDMVAIVQAYKFMSNEYRHFPMRFAANCCKAIAANVGGLRTAMKCGNYTGCPFVKGITTHACHWYPDPSKLPPYIPNGQYKIEMQMSHFKTEVNVVNAYLTVYRPIV